MKKLLNLCEGFSLGRRFFFCILMASVNFSHADEFFNHQYKHGYFDYKRDGFGPVCETYSDVKRTLLKYAEQDFKNKETYLEKERAFFTLHDQDNCERNYQAIKALDNCLSQA